MTAFTTGTVPVSSGADDQLLRFALRADATLCAGLGLFIAMAADALAPLTGLTATAEWLFGAALVGYGAVLYTVARVRAVRRVGQAVLAGNVTFAGAAALVLGAGWLPLTTMVHKACHAPALCYGVQERGYLREGYYADLTLANPDATTTVTPESILPANTFALSTVPDVNAARTAFKAAPLTRFWNDPSMARFTEKFSFAVEKNILEPLLIQGNIDINEYSSLLQGQLTFALTRQVGEEIPGVIFILDSGKESEALKEKLADLRETLVDNDVPHNRLRIQGADFIHIKAPEE